MCETCALYGLGGVYYGACVSSMARSAATRVNYVVYVYDGEAEVEPPMDGGEFVDYAEIGVMNGAVVYVGMAMLDLW